MKGFAFVAVVCALVAMAFAMQSKTMMAESEIVDVAYCMNNCSYPVGGYCNPNFGCVCNAGYAGPDCSVAIVPINNFQRVSDSLASGLWKFYSIVIDANTIQLLVEMTRDIATGDPDLYLRFGSAPDRTHYDFADFGTGNLHSISILQNTGQLQYGTYFIGVYAYGAQDTQFTVEPRMYQCPNDCNARSGHGVCNGASHLCSCAPGWVQDDCSASNVPLSASTPTTITGTLGAMEWMYFEMQITTDNLVNNPDYFVSVNKTTTTGFGYIDLFVANGRFPTQDDFDYRSNLNAANNNIKVCTSSLQTGVMRIGIQNWGFAGSNFSLSSALTGNCMARCTQHGVCRPDGSCACNPGFLGADCDVNLAQVLAGTTAVGTAVFLSFFFLILGATPFLIWHFCGQRIKAFIAARRGGSGFTASAGDDFPASTGSVNPAPAATAAGSYQTF
jgi:hypothetical protein